MTDPHQPSGESGPDGPVVRPVLDPGDAVDRDAPPRTSEQPRDDHRLVLARQLARALSIAVAVLRWPSLLLIVIPVLPLAVVIHAAFGAARLADTIALAVVGVVGMVIELAFLLMRRRFLAATADREALAMEMRALLSVRTVSDEVFVLLRDVAAKGGWLVLRRLRSVWKLVRLPEHLLEHLKNFPRARVFIPPSLGISGITSVAQLWLAALSWPVMVLVLALRATGVIG